MTMPRPERVPDNKEPVPHLLPDSLAPAAGEHFSIHQLLSPASLALILEQAPDGIVVASADGTMHYVNLMMSKLFGFSREELLGMNVRILLPPTLRDMHDQHLLKLRGRPESHIFGLRREVTAQHRDGHGVPVDLHVTSVAGRLEFQYVAIVSDIRERKLEEIKRQILADSLMSRLDDLKHLRQEVSQYRDRDTGD